MAKKYELTPEHRAQLKPWADKWIANAMSTKAMDDTDRVAMRAAIKGLYEAANLTPPPPERIVFVPSPLVGNVASGFAAAIWWMRKTDAATEDATREATDAATRAATSAATRAATSVATFAATDAATFAATNAATREATDAATREATSVATSAATEDATFAATDAATFAATNAATREATDAATRGWAVDIAARFDSRNVVLMTSCALSAWRMRNGGNHWSAWVSYLSFFRHVAKLPIDYSKWRHYESAAIHGSWRWMHPDFCIVSDRPKTLKVDHLNRSHCADGPSHEWRDGWNLYHWKGLSIPAELIEKRHEMTPDQIRAITNAEHRRAAIEIYASVHGPDKFVKDLGATLVKSDKAQNLPRKLYSVGGNRYVHVVNGSLEPDGTRREFLLGAHPDAKSPHEAVAMSYGRTAAKFKEAVRT